MGSQSTVVKIDENWIPPPRTAAFVSCRSPTAANHATLIGGGGRACVLIKVQPDDQTHGLTKGESNGHVAKQERLTFFTDDFGQRSPVIQKKMLGNATSIA